MHDIFYVLNHINVKVEVYFCIYTCIIISGLADPELFIMEGPLTELKGVPTPVMLQ